MIQLALKVFYLNAQLLMFVTVNSIFPVLARSLHLDLVGFSVHDTDANLVNVVLVFVCLVLVSISVFFSEFFIARRKLITLSNLSSIRLENGKRFKK